MPAIDITDRVKAIQYDGTNSAEINGLITDFTIDSEGGGFLSFTSAGTPYTIPTGDWVRYSQGFVLNTHTTAFLNFAFIRNAIYDDLPDISGIETDITALETEVSELADAVSALEGGLLAAGVHEAPLLIVGSTVVAVDVVPSLPDTSYTPHAQLFAATSILGPLTITNVAVVDVNTVNVTISNSSLVGINGARILVTVTS